MPRWVLDRENADRLDDHHLLCCWDDCDRNALDIWSLSVDYGRPGYEYRTTYVFCCEPHKMMWAYSHRDLYNLPPGYSGRFR